MIGKKLAVALVLAGNIALVGGPHVAHADIPLCAVVPTVPSPGAAETVTARNGGATVSCAFVLLTPPPQILSVALAADGPASAIASVSGTGCSITINWPTPAASTACSLTPGPYLLNLTVTASGTAQAWAQFG
jgi:hypothetical protein